MMRRCAGLNTDEAWHQLLEECQDITSLQLAPDDHLAYRVDAVDLKNRLRDVETDRRDPVHAALLRIVVTPAATTSMALTCRWRSRPQHHYRTSDVILRILNVGEIDQKEIPSTLTSTAGAMDKRKHDLCPRPLRGKGIFARYRAACRHNGEGGSHVHLRDAAWSHVVSCRTAKTPRAGVSLLRSGLDAASSGGGCPAAA